MVDWMDWSSWLLEGHFISYMAEAGRMYEHVVARDLAHWEYDWPEDIVTNRESGPYVPDDLEITRGYNEKSGSILNQLWQVLFGFNQQVYVYVELPTDLHRHGIPKEPKPGTHNWRTSHYEEWMTPFFEPSFLSEHYMMRPTCIQIAFSAYNPNTITTQDLRLNFFINKLITERIGMEIVSEETGGVILQETRSRFKEVLEKLYKRLTPCRYISLVGVRAPAEAPGGE